MQPKRYLKRLRHRLANAEFRHGVDACSDLRRWKRHVGTVFDVGANVGQSAFVFAEAFPEARIYCFEPVRETFETLEENTRGNPNIACFCRALGPGKGSAAMTLHKGSVNNAISDVPGTGGNGADAPVRMVDLDSLDGFCEGQGIEWIDFLKIDTEGFDLKVLEGAGGMLGAQRIGFLQVEASMSRFNQKHVPFAAFTELLEPLGYALFGLYDQVPEWSGEARLRFCNPVFVSEAETQRLGLFPIESSKNGLRPKTPKELR